MLPITIGLHGLLFAIPIPSVDNSEAEKPKSENSVNVVNLPKPSPSAIASPQPSPRVQPSVRVQPSPAVMPSPQQAIQPQVSPSPQSSTSPSPTVSPSPSTSPSPSVSPSPTDALAIVGATPGCRGKAGCWKLTESNGRTIAGTLEQKLESQGFTYSDLNAEPDTGFRVYEVAKDGVKQYYLHMIWNDRGTAYVRDENQLSYDQLVAEVQL
jgi:hypothetical protein